MSPAGGAETMGEAHGLRAGCGTTRVWPSGSTITARSPAWAPTRCRLPRRSTCRLIARRGHRRCAGCTPGAGAALRRRPISCICSKPLPTRPPWRSSAPNWPMRPSRRRSQVETERTAQLAAQLRLARSAYAAGHHHRRDQQPARGWRDARRQPLRARADAHAYDEANRLNRLVGNLLDMTRH